MICNIMGCIDNLKKYILIRRQMMTKRFLGLLVVSMLTVSILSGCSQPADPKATTQENEEIAEIVEESNDNNMEKVDLGVLSPVFLDATEAATALSNEDEYIMVLSSYDYAAKYKSEKPLDKEERLAFFKLKTLDFNDNERARIEEAMMVIHNKIADAGIALPESVGFIKTDGTEEGGAAYTRALNIIIPKQYFNMNKKRFDALISHEYFHVYSRYFSEHRPELYELIGFKTSKGVNLPESIKELTIANPDAPDTIYYFTDIFEGKKHIFFQSYTLVRPMILKVITLSLRR